TGGSHRRSIIRAWQRDRHAPYYTSGAEMTRLFPVIGKEEKWSYRTGKDSTRCIETILCSRPPPSLRTSRQQSQAVQIGLAEVIFPLDPIGRLAPISLFGHG